MRIHDGTRLVTPQTGAAGQLVQKVRIEEGCRVPPGRRMGHAGAIASGSSGTAEAKTAALRHAGVAVAEGPYLIGRTVRDLLRDRRRHGGRRPTAKPRPADAPAVRRSSAKVGRKAA